VFIRDIVEEKRFTQDLDNFRKIYARMDEVFYAFSWALAKDPRLGTSLEQAPDFWLFETTEAGDTPAFWVLYSFDQQKVHLHSIEPVAISDDED